MLIRRFLYESLFNNDKKALIDPNSTLRFMWRCFYTLHATSTYISKAFSNKIINLCCYFERILVFQSKILCLFGKFWDIFFQFFGNWPISIFFGLKHVIWPYNQKKRNEARKLIFCRNIQMDLVGVHAKTHRSSFFHVPAIGTFHILCLKHDILTMQPKKCEWGQGIFFFFKYLHEYSK